MLRPGDLLARARRGSPPLTTANAAAAEGGRRLVERSWCPDVSLGAAATQREDGPAGYTLTAGLRVPLQWGLRRAQGREATARLEAARARQDGALLGLRAVLEAALATLEAAHQSEGVRLDLLAVQEREQTALAELERLVGGEL